MKRLVVMTSEEEDVERRLRELMVVWASRLFQPSVLLSLEVDLIN
jgi:hypothetical protein